MSNPVTLEDILQIFTELKEDTKSRAREFDRRLAESKAEADLRSEEADRRLEKLERLFEESKVEANHRSTEADRSLEELKKLVASANASVNNLTSRWGRFVENLVEPAAVKLFQQRGINVKETHPRMKVRRGEIAMEIDILSLIHI